MSYCLEILTICILFLSSALLEHLWQSSPHSHSPLIQDSVYNLSRQYEEKVRPCIDLIDSLRALGVEQDLALPAIAVIGDQSSGKSSVLEALSGVALPRGSGERSVLLALPGRGPGTSEIATDIL